MESSTSYEGPRDGDPLTEGELGLLLAIPHAAQATPDAMLFRLPLGPDPAMGWVDVSCAESYSIIARLAANWNTRLSEILHKHTGKCISTIGPGTTICIFVQPVVHSLFHHLAFMALGCTIQYISLALDEDGIESNLRMSNCKIAIYSGVDEAWVNGMRARFNGEIVQLPEDQYAHRIALTEKQKSIGPPPSWPAPRRPTPTVIIHSSATTGVPKLLRLSLHYFVLGLPPKGNDSFKPSNSDTLKPNSRLKTPQTHPFLIFSPPFWQSFHALLFGRLITATPVSFAHVPDIVNLPSSQLIAWARGLDVGAIFCAPRFLREIPKSLFDAQAEFLRSLYLILVCGAAVDNSMSSLIEKYELPVMVQNAYGCSEFGGIMYAPIAPYTHLRPFPEASPPLVLPISDPEPDGSRQVQLWYSLSTSRHLAHLHARGGVPLKLQPFPGKGPHEGELAADIGDIFKEVRVPSSASTGFDVTYVYLGRSDDRIRLAVDEGWDIIASTYEVELWSAIDLRLRSRGHQWILSAIQLFGTDMLCTALVIQLSLAGQAWGEVELGQDIVQDVYSSVEEVNHRLKLGPRVRVHPDKRMLIITSQGGMYGPGTDRFQEEMPALMVTHKHTLQRWKNVQSFKPWLDGLDFSEP